MNSLGRHRTLLICVFVSIFNVTIPMTYNSPRLLLSESTIVTKVEGTRLQVNCRAKILKPIQSLKWMAIQLETSTFNQYNVDNATVSLIFSSLHRSDAGTYRCMLITVDGEVITEDFSLRVRSKNRSVSTCRITQFKCKITEHCIFTRYRCDGKDDCGDGSDEDCEVDPCENKFRCNNSRCVKHEMLCDHVDNCGDGSDEQAFCYERKVPTTEVPQEKNSLSLPKRTIFMIIAGIIVVVILICFIVILGCRAKMKRQRREARLGLEGAMNSTRLRSQEMRETPRSPSQAEENSGEGQPFLLNAYQPYWNGRNIIVNVNNGVQYIPQYDCAMRSFMEAPPPYSEVRGSRETNENAPPPYSTLRQDQSPEWQAANQTTTNSRPESSADRQHTPDRSAGSDRRSPSHEYASISQDSHGRAQVNENSGPLSRRAGPRLGLPNAGIQDGNMGNLSGPRNQLENPGVNDSGQTLPECSSYEYEASTIPSRPCSCLIQAPEGHSDASSPQAPDTVAVSSFASRPESTDAGIDVTTSLADGNVDLPFSDGANEQSSNPSPNNSVTHLPSTPINRNEIISVNPSSQSRHNSPNSTLTNNSHNLADPVSASVFANQNAAPGHPAVDSDHVDASRALLQEVSRRDERNKLQPGHLSVQGGQIILHTDNGVIAGQTVVPTIGGAGHTASQGQGSDQATGAASQLGGEIVVRDGVIMLQIPVSQLILNQQNASSNQQNASSNQQTASSPATEPSQNATGTSEPSARQAPEQECNDCLSPTLSASPPAESTSRPVSDHPVTSLPSQGGRRRGDLNIRDGQIVLEPPRHTPSSQILSHLQGAYSQEESDPLLGDPEDRQVIEPVGNTKRTPGQASGGRHATSKCNSDIVLSHAKDHQGSL